MIFQYHFIIKIMKWGNLGGEEIKCPCIICVANAGMCGRCYYLWLICLFEPSSGDTSVRITSDQLLLPDTSICKLQAKHAICHYTSSRLHKYKININTMPFVITHHSFPDNSLTQFSPTNVHKRGLKHHHVCSRMKNFPLPFCLINSC